MTLEPSLSSLVVTLGLRGAQKRALEGPIFLVGERPGEAKIRHCGRGDDSKRQFRPFWAKVAPVRGACRHCRELILEVPRHLRATWASRYLPGIPQLLTGTSALRCLLGTCIKAPNRHLGCQVPVKYPQPRHLTGIWALRCLSGTCNQCT